MHKKIKAYIKLAIPAGKATPSPPIGPALGQHGVNIVSFCKEYNVKTADKIGYIIPVKITIFEDKSYNFVLKSPLTSNLLKKMVFEKNFDSQAKKSLLVPNNRIIYKDQLRKIASIKLLDLNTSNMEKAVNIISGTAKNMGIIIE